MAEFTEVMKQFNRMCDYYLTDEGICHTECPLYKLKSTAYGSCTNCIFKYSQDTENMVMKWANEHRVITNRDKFKELFNDNYKDAGCYSCDRNNNGLPCAHCEWWDSEYTQ